MNGTIDRWTKPGELLHAMLEGWIVAEISDATLAKARPAPSGASRRGAGFQSIRASQVSGAEHFKAVHYYHELKPSRARA